MDFLNFVRRLLFWSFDQAAAIPWGALSYMPVSKVMLLSSIMALFTLFLYRMAWAFMEAG
jgi:hypothetical protein